MVLTDDGYRGGSAGWGCKNGGEPWAGESGRGRGRGREGECQGEGEGECEYECECERAASDVSGNRAHVIS